ncbi:MAG: DUF1573 domain-containing protein [Planctomycetia bacterium]
MQSISARLVAGAALMAGLAVGLGSAALDAAMRPWRVGDFFPALTDTSSSPRVDVPETRHEFGKIGSGEKGTHAFTIGNSGSVPLTLSRGATSCSCTMSDLGQDAPRTVLPGDTTTVSVQWTGKGKGGAFRQQVTVLTNDPRRPEIVFAIEGTVVPKWRAMPEMLTLPKLSPQSTASITARVFTYGEEPSRVESLEALDERTTNFFTLSSSPLAADDISREPGATGGFLVEVGVKPGLPVGPLRQTVRVVFRMPEEITTEIPVEGQVAGDFSFAGPAWDASRQKLMLGQISGRTGLKTTFFLTARGPDRDLVRPVVKEVVPSLLDIRVGVAEPIGTGAVIRIPIDVEIPPGSPSVNHLGSEQAPAGRIVLGTGLPDSPSVTLPVSVVVGP